MILGPRPLSALETLKRRQPIIQYPTRGRRPADSHPRHESATPAAQEAARLLADDTPVTLDEARRMFDRVNASWRGQLDHVTVIFDEDQPGEGQYRQKTSTIALHPRRVNRQNLAGVLVHESIHVILLDRTEPPVPADEPHGETFQKFARQMDGVGGPRTETQAESWLPSPTSWFLKGVMADA